MKASVVNVQGEKVGDVELPQVFESAVNEELINRAFWILFTHSLQPQGRSRLAGKEYSVESMGPGYGMSRVARVKGAGTRRAGQAGGIAGVVKGRLAHPPKAEKVIYKRINKKEKLAATASAIAATARPDLVRKRGHRVDGSLALPIVVEDSLEDMSKAKDVLSFLEKLKLSDDVKRVKERGSGAGPLIVVSGGKILNVAKNVPGVEVVKAKDCSVLDLAPGGKAGRLAIYTVKAIKDIEERFKVVGRYGY